MMSLFSCDMNTELQLMFGKAISFSTSNRYQIHPTKTVASVLSGKVGKVIPRVLRRGLYSLLLGPPGVQLMTFCFRFFSGVV